MQCPKCHGDMRSYERNGITIDQCTECRGVFLDRGELDHLTALKETSAAPAEAAQPVAPTYSGRAPEPSSGGRPYKKRRSFLEELFD